MYCDDAIDKAVHSWIMQTQLHKIRSEKIDGNCIAALGTTELLKPENVFSHPLPWLVGSPSAQGDAPLVVYSGLAHWWLAVLITDDADPSANSSVPAAPH